jgi:hypothetical protein
MKRIVIYVLLGPLVGAATVLLIPWASRPPALTIWQLISNPKNLLLPYMLGLPVAFLVSLIDYSLRNYRWQWVYVVLGAGLICAPFYVGDSFWLAGIAPAGICSFFANFRKNETRPLRVKTGQYPKKNGTGPLCRCPDE